MVGAGDKKEGADTEKHIESTKNAEKVQRNAEKAQRKHRKRKKVYGLRNEEGADEGDKIAVRGGENALNTKGKSCAFQVLL